MSLDTALTFTLAAEGGYVDNHWDHGGPTNRGITQAVYDDWHDEHKLPRRSVAMLTDQETRAIYTERYWQAGHCDALPDKLATCHFDWCVNGGVSRASRNLQAALGIEVDGIFGNGTAAAAAACDDLKTCTAYQFGRLQWYIARVQQRPDQGRFLKGWENRLTELNTLLAIPSPASSTPP